VPPPKDFHNIAIFNNSLYFDFFFSKKWVFLVLQNNHFKMQIETRSEKLTILVFHNITVRNNSPEFDIFELLNLKARDFV
jgi:hypothetical protein